jgi:hypothetical protein
LLQHRRREFRQGQHAVPAGGFLHQPVEIAKAKKISPPTCFWGSKNQINEFKQNYNRSLRNLVYQWFRNGAVAFLYGFGFRSVSKPGEMVDDKLDIGYELIGRLEEGEA